MFTQQQTRTPPRWVCDMTNLELAQKACRMLAKRLETVSPERREEVLDHFYGEVASLALQARRSA